MDGRAALRQSARRSPAAGSGHSDAEGRARVPHRRAAHAHLLRKRPEVLPRARRRDAARESRDDRQVRREPGTGRRLGVVRRQHEEPAAESRQPRAPRRSARRAGRGDQAAHRDDPAALSLHWRPAQRRIRTARDADGARVPAGDRNVAVHHGDSRERDRVSDARGRRGRARSQRRSLLLQSGFERRSWWWRCWRGRRGGTSRRTRRRRWRVQPAVLGQVRLSRQQPRH